MVEADVTLAFVAPKKTILFEGVASKLVPVMVTELPVLPEVGVNEDRLIVLGAPGEDHVGPFVNVPLKLLLVTRYFLSLSL